MEDKSFEACFNKLSRRKWWNTALAILGVSATLALVLTLINSGKRHQNQQRTRMRSLVGGPVNKKPSSRAMPAHELFGRSMVPIRTTQDWNAEEFTRGETLSWNIHGQIKPHRGFSVVRPPAMARPKAVQSVTGTTVRVVRLPHETPMFVTEASVIPVSDIRRSVSSVVTAAYDEAIGFESGAGKSVVPEDKLKQRLTTKVAKAVTGGKPEFDPTIGIVYNRLMKQATGYFFKGRFKKAIPLLRRAVRIDRFDSRAQLMLGTALYEAFRNWQAVRNLRRAVQLDPNLNESYLFLASAYQMLGKNQRAKRALLRYLRRDPGGHFITDVHKIIRKL